MKSVLDFGAVGDGLADDTAAIQVAINAAGSDVLFPSGKWFKVNPGIGIKIPSDRRLYMHGAYIQIAENVAPRSRAFETVPGASSIEILGGTIQGDRMAAPGLQWGIGLRIDQASNVLVRGTRFESWFFDGAWVGGNQPSQNVRFEECLFANNRRNGLSVVNADDVSLNRCSFTDTNGQDPQAGCDVEPNPGERVTRFSAFGCYFTNNASVGLYMHRGRGTAGEDYKIVGCTFDENRRYGLVGNAMSRLLVSDNEVSGGQTAAPFGVGISIGDGASELTLTDNDIHSPRGLVLAGVKNLRVVNNRMTGGRPEIVAAGVQGDVVLLKNEAVA